MTRILFLTPVGKLVSNPNWSILDRRGWRYRLSTSRFQKSDTVLFAVSKAAILGASFL